MTETKEFIMKKLLLKGDFRLESSEIKSFNKDKHLNKKLEVNTITFTENSFSYIVQFVVKGEVIETKCGYLISTDRIDMFYLFAIIKSKVTAFYLDGIKNKTVKKKDLLSIPIIKL